MNEEQKTKIKEVVGNAAEELSDKALAAAKEQTNKLWKLLLYAVGVMLAGIAALAGFTGCNGVPQVTAEQVQVAHDVYHAVTGEPCVFVVESVKK
jgi:hypothetical protein